PSSDTFSKLFIALLTRLDTGINLSVLFLFDFTCNTGLSVKSSVIQPFFNSKTSPIFIPVSILISIRFFNKTLYSCFKEFSLLYSLSLYCFRLLKTSIYEYIHNHVYTLSLKELVLIRIYIQLHPR